MFKLSLSPHLFTLAALAAPLLLGGCVVAQPAPYYQRAYVEPAPAPAPVVYAEPAPVYYAPAPVYVGPPVAVGVGFYGGRGWHGRWR